MPDKEEEKEGTDWAEIFGHGVRFSNDDSWIHG